MRRRALIISAGAFAIASLFTAGAFPLAMAVRAREDACRAASSPLLPGGGIRIASSRGVPEKQSPGTRRADVGKLWTTKTFVDAVGLGDRTVFRVAVG